MSKIASITKTAGAVGVALMALTGGALAEEFTWSVNAAGTSDYVFRGVSQSDEDPAFQAGIDASYGIVYAGIWGSSVDSEFIGGSPAEVDLYAGVKPVLGPATFDFGVIYYWYPGEENQPLEQDYVELKAGVSGTFIPNLSTGFNLYWTDDGTLESGEYFVYEGNAGYTLPAVGIFTPSISGVLGYLDHQEDDTLSYTYWNAGISLAVEKFTLDFRYWDTDTTVAGPSGNDLADERFVFTAKVVLP
ncbi:MAG: TorF family putative porin [Hyphomicrobium sp.]|uniref:TorF family putative porin n=1 Tax=Hyphomicrobium sp. TaxID=82 RepID=UPI003D13C1EC